MKIMRAFLARFFYLCPVAKILSVCVLSRIGVSDTCMPSFQKRLVSVKTQIKQQTVRFVSLMKSNTTRNLGWLSEQVFPA